MLERTRAHARKQKQRALSARAAVWLSQVRASQEERKKTLALSEIAAATATGGG